MSETIESLNLEIEKLKKKCDEQSTFIRRMLPDKFEGTLFISGQLGEVDGNGLPEMLLIVPAYGCDWSQVYVKSEKTTGPEW